MRFTPVTESELQVAKLLPEGIYSYEVKVSEEKLSEAGNDYISLRLKVWDEDGKEHIIFTNLALKHLLKHFCDVNDMQEEYKSGNIPQEQFLNKCGGSVCIGIEGEKPNPKGGTFRAKNIVKDYVKLPGSKLKPLPKPKDDFLNDEIPF